MNDSISYVDISQNMGQGNTSKFRGGIKSQYDAVMETIVQKDE
mgnify:CR=1 FL=1|jgi:hypothetical protein